MHCTECGIIHARVETYKQDYGLFSSKPDNVTQANNIMNAALRGLFSRETDFRGLSARCFEVLVSLES